jgi:biopolymer transport protein ExbD
MRAVVPIGWKKQEVRNVRMAKEPPEREEIRSLRDALPSVRKRRGLALPLTPLIDVTFLLLLYFLLTSTFRDPEQQMMAPVPSPGGEQSILLPIHITLRPAGEFGEGAVYRIGDGNATGRLSRVRAALGERARVARDPEVPVVIHADTEVRWNHVVEVFSAASGAGFRAVTFAPAEGGTEGRGR